MVYIKNANKKIWQFERREISGNIGYVRIIFDYFTTQQAPCVVFVFNLVNSDKMAETC